MAWAATGNEFTSYRHSTREGLEWWANAKQRYFIVLKSLGSAGSLVCISSSGVLKSLDKIVANNSSSWTWSSKGIGLDACPERETAFKAGMTPPFANSVSIFLFIWAAASISAAFLALPFPWTLSMMSWLLSLTVQTTVNAISWGGPFLLINLYSGMESCCFWHSSCRLPFIFTVGSPSVLSFPPLTGAGLTRTGGKLSLGNWSNMFCAALTLASFLFFPSPRLSLAPIERKQTNVLSWSGPECVNSYSVETEFLAAYSFILPIGLVSAIFFFFN